MRRADAVLLFSPTRSSWRYLVLLLQWELSLELLLLSELTHDATAVDW